MRSTTFLASSNASVSSQRSDIEKLSSNRTMWCVFAPPNIRLHRLRSSGWATSSTTAAMATIRSSKSSSCLRMTQVRFFFWLTSRNSIAAHSTRRCRIMLIRWINTGAAAIGSPQSSAG